MPNLSAIFSDRPWVAICACRLLKSKEKSRGGAQGCCSRENDFKIDRIVVLVENVGLLNRFRHFPSSLGGRGNPHFQRLGFDLASSRDEFSENLQLIHDGRPSREQIPERFPSKVRDPADNNDPHKIGRCEPRAEYIGWLHCRQIMRSSIIVLWGGGGPAWAWDGHPPTRWTDPPLYWLLTPAKNIFDLKIPRGAVPSRCVNIFRASVCRNFRPSGAHTFITRAIKLPSFKVSAVSGALAVRSLTSKGTYSHAQLGSSVVPRFTSRGVTICFAMISCRTAPLTGTSAPAPLIWVSQTKRSS